MLGQSFVVACLKNTTTKSTAIAYEYHLLLVRRLARELYYVSKDHNVFNKARDVVLLEVEYSAHFPVVLSLVLYVCRTIG